jgi:hypothetical protein
VARHHRIAEPKRILDGAAGEGGGPSTIGGSSGIRSELEAGGTRPAEAMDDMRNSFGANLSAAPKAGIELHQPWRLSAF